MIPEDVKKLAELFSEEWVNCGTRLEDSIADAIMADRASRLPRQEDEIRKAALEEAEAIVDAQPFYPDTHTGMRQQWVKDQIKAKLRALSQKGDEVDG